MEIVYLPYQIDGINLHIKEVLNQVLSTYYIKSKNCYDKVGIWKTLTTPSKTRADRSTTGPKSGVIDRILTFTLSCSSSIQRV